MTEERSLIIQSPHLMPALSVQQATHRYRSLVSFVRELMIEGTDYGTVPGTNKPTLLKPGAEKLTTFFGLTPKFPVQEKVEDWTGRDHGEPFFYYWFKCELWRGDTLIAEGDGSANSWESKYRWRWVPADEIPAGLDKKQLRTRSGSAVEFAFAIEKAETEGQYGKPAEYWQAFEEAKANGTAIKTTKKTRAGKEYAAYQITTTVYRVPNEDIFSQVNTLQKMAAKRALVAATLIGANASEFFTQDVEDMDLGDFVDGEFASVTNGAAVIEKDTPAPTDGDNPKPPPAPKKANPQPRAQQQQNGNSTARVASIKVDASLWKQTTAELAAASPIYAKGGMVNFYQITKTAARLGYDTITDANLEEVMGALLADAAAQGEMVQEADEQESDQSELDKYFDADEPQAQMEF